MNDKVLTSEAVKTEETRGSRDSVAEMLLHHSGNNSKSIPIRPTELKPSNGNDFPRIQLSPPQIQLDDRPFQLSEPASKFMEPFVKDSWALRGQATLNTLDSKEMALAAVAGGTVGVVAGIGTGLLKDASKIIAEQMQHAPGAFFNTMLTGQHMGDFMPHETKFGASVPKYALKGGLGVAALGLVAYGAYKSYENFNVSKVEAACRANTDPQSMFSILACQRSEK